MNTYQVLLAEDKKRTSVLGIIHRLIKMAIPSIGLLTFLFMLIGSSAKAQCPDSKPVSASGTGIMLEYSEENVVYRLFKDGSSLGQTQYGNGGILYWTNLCSGVYTVVATANACDVTMNGTVTLTTGTLGTPTTPSPANSTRCQGGGTTQFSSSAANAQYLSWSITPEAGSITSSGLVTWNSNFVGTATITVTAYGCSTSSSSSTTMSVTGALGQLSAIGGTENRCAGTGIANFTASAANAESYSWSIYPEDAGWFNQAIPSRMEWNPSFAGTATVTVIAYGCGGSTTRSATISTIAPPSMPSTPSADGGITTRCMGAGTTMYSIPAAANASSYVWSITPGAGTISGVGTSAQVSWNSSFSGQATVSVASIGCNGGATAAASTGMYITPVPIQPSTPVSVSGYSRCQGAGQSTFTTSSQNADSYNWSITSGAGSISSSGVVTWNSSFYGQALITVSASNCSGTSSVSESRIVYVEQSGPLSPISGPLSRCRGGGTTSYSSSAPNATGYNWTVSPSSAGQFLSPGVLTWDSSFSGTATITVTATSCTGTLSQTATVEVTSWANVPSTPVPSGGLTSRCQGAGTTSYSIPAAAGAVSYQWSVTAGAGTISGTGTTATVTWNSGFSGSATVSVASVSCDGNPTAVASVGMSISPLATVPSTPVPDGGLVSRCQGAGTTSYSIPAAAGAVSYQWSVTAGAGTISGTGTTATVTWNSGFSGSATVSVASVSCNGNPTAAASVGMSIIQPAGKPTDPVAAGGITSRCKGTGSTTYTASATGENITYDWSVSPSEAGTWSGTGASRTITWSASFAGVAIISVSANGCAGASASSSTTMTVTEPLVPTVSISSNVGSSIIAGTSVIFTASPVNGGSSPSYQWTVDGINVGTNQATYTTSTLLNGQVISCILSSSAACIVSSTAQAAGITMTVGIAPGSNYNHIRETIVQTRGIITNIGVQSLSMDNKVVNTTYFDGLGRAMQKVNHRLSPSGKDIVLPIEYDQIGREVKKYLPYSDSGTDYGSYRTNAITAQNLFYNSPPASVVQIPVSGSSTPSFAETVFEASPLNRIQEQGAPGAAWQAGGGHTLKNDYLLNNNIAFGQSGTNLSDSRQVALYTVSIASDGVRTLVRANNNDTYSDNQLTVTVQKDENWTSGRPGTTEEYKDKNGQVVLKRTYNLNGSSVEQLSTYYVYDDFGNLAFVLPQGANPDAAAAISSSTLNNFCYQYRYDVRQRLVEKRLPGKGAEYMVYNKIDQLVATQDANQRAKATPEWTFMKYDVFGRNIGSGIYIHTSPAISRTDLQTVVDSTTVFWETPPAAATALADVGYSDLAFPVSGTKIWQTVHYYDTYNYLPLTDLAFADSYGQSPISMPRGLSTASKVRVLDSGSWLLSANYYNDKGELIQTQAANNIGGKDVYSSKYTFDGLVSDKQRRHHKASMTTPDLTITERFIYDAARRLVQHYHKTNSGAEISLASYAYNEIGQLKEKQLHENTGTGGAMQHVTLNSADNVASGETKIVTAEVSITLQPGFIAASGSTFTAKIEDVPSRHQVLSYAYNERGWLKSINDPTTVADDKVFGMKLYYEDHGTADLKQYNGNISRVDWKVKVPTLLTQLGTQSYDYEYDKLNRLNKANYLASGNNNKYNEQVSYDMMGNITALKRRNVTSSYLHDFTYSYTNGNQLSSITDSGTAVLSSAYSYDVNGNMLSDSKKAITLSYNQLNLPSTVTKSGSNTLTYQYDASGRKLKKTFGSDVRDYVDGIEYHNGSIELVQTAEGRMLPSGGSYTYEYMLKDHLGNIRAMVKADGSIIDVSDYYAFGLEIGDPITPSPDNNYKYNGKEWNSELLLNSYDYGARFYDPVVGRWNVVDPLSEKYMNTSPFAYVANNPISAYDGDGRKIIYVNGYYSRLLNLMGFAPGSGKESYWNYFSPSFIPSSRSFIGAANNELNEFVDGSSAVGFDQSGQDRYSLGMQYALENYSELRKGMAKGESFKFVSHSEGGAFAAGMAAYLISRGETVESMLYLSPDEADEFSSPLGTFTMQAHFQDDKISPSMRLDGVDVFMNFKTLNGKEVGRAGAHGATVSKAAVNKMKEVLGKLGPYVNKLMTKGSWSVTETKDGYKFKREDEENDEQ